MVDPLKTNDVCFIKPRHTAIVHRIIIRTSD